MLHLKEKCCFVFTQKNERWVGHKHDKFSRMTHRQQMPRGKALTKMLSCVLTWPPPLLTLKSHSSPKFSALFQDLVHSDTQKDAHQQTRLQTVFTQCWHSEAAWLLLFFWLWWMRRAVQRSGTNAVNTFPARRGRLNQRLSPTELADWEFWAKVVTGTGPSRGKHGGDVHFKEVIAVFICRCVQAGAQKWEGIWDFIVLCVSKLYADTYRHAIVPALM